MFSVTSYVAWVHEDSDSSSLRVTQWIKSIESQKQKHRKNIQLMKDMFQENEVPSTLVEGLM